MKPSRAPSIKPGADAQSGIHDHAHFEKGLDEARDGTVVRVNDPGRKTYLR